MKENYSVKCENILNNLDGKKKLLLHSCCGPCSSYVISYLTNYFDITILYYNPNIYPYDEYLKRKQEQIKLINEIDCSNNLDIMDCDYDNDYYNECINRCNNFYYNNNLQMADRMVEAMANGTLDVDGNFINNTSTVFQGKTMGFGYLKLFGFISWIFSFLILMIVFLILS